MHINKCFVHWCGKKLLAWGQPGVEPGTFCSRIENYTPRPLSQESQDLCHNIRASPVIAPFLHSSIFNDRLLMSNRRI